MVVTPKRFLIDEGLSKHGDPRSWRVDAKLAVLCGTRSKAQTLTSLLSNDFADSLEDTIAEGMLVKADVETIEAEPALFARLTDQSLTVVAVSTTTDRLPETLESLDSANLSLPPVVDRISTSTTAPSSEPHSSLIGRAPTFAGGVGWLEAACAILFGAMA